jgi:hypothetical protein
MSMQPGTGRAPRVLLDSSPERCTTLTGWALWLRILARAGCTAILAGSLAGTVALLAGAEPARAVAAVALGAVAWVIAAPLLAAFALDDDLRAKRVVCARYRCAARRGGDAEQRRSLTIEQPPAELATCMAAALCELSPRVRVYRLAPGHLEALRPAPGPLTPGTRLEVQLRKQEDGSARASLRCHPRGAPLTRLLFPARAHPDRGRSIESVEALQLRLSRILEGVPAASAVAQVTAAVSAPTPSVNDRHATTRGAASAVEITEDLKDPRSPESAGDGGQTARDARAREAT